MARIKLSLAFAVFVLALPQNAFSEDEWIFESGLGYRTGSYEFNSAAKGSAAGVGFEGRILYVMAPVFFGLDTGYWMGNSVSASGTQIPSSGILVGPTLGAGLKKLRLRFWASYFALDYYIHQNPSFGEIRYAGGGGLKLGLGFEVLRMISLNFDFITHTFKRQEIRDLETTMDLNPNLKFTEYVLSLTIPFSSADQRPRSRNAR